ncbi:hypothetical protein FQA39_LY14341 [Lamprigera yunnana]|nr:hypothetical protein FQA39_LY14341 [Lamprigera yunnana]
MLTCLEDESPNVWVRSSLSLDIRLAGVSKPDLDQTDRSQERIGITDGHHEARGCMGRVPALSFLIGSNIHYVSAVKESNFLPTYPNITRSESFGRKVRTYGFSVQWSYFGVAAAKLKQRKGLQ